MPSDQSHPCQIQSSGPTLQSLFSQQATQTPDAIAISVDAEPLSYRQLESQSNFLAHRLHSLGLKPEQACGLLLERSAALMVAYLAILKAGAVCVPIDADHPANRIDFILSNAETSFLITQTGLIDRVGNTNATCLYVDRIDWKKGLDHPPVNGTDSSPDPLACILYTSGSTGNPKGVQVTQRGLVNCMNWLQSEFSISPGDRVLMKTSIGFDVSIAELFWPVLNGATIVIAEPEGHRNAAYLLQALSKEEITHFILTPSLLRALLELPGPDPFKAQKLIISTGEALPLDLLQAYFQKVDTPLFNLYGPTEASIWASLWKCQPEAEFVSIGKPISHTQLYVLDANLQSAAVECEGEIYIGGEGLARGYHKLPKQTSEAFIANPLPGCSGMLYKTGDRGRFRRNGELEYLGRIDDQIQVRGERIEPGEIESCLRQHKGVKNAAVASHTHAPGDDRIHAWIQANQKGASIDPNDLKAFLKQRLPSTLIPSQYYFVDSLPQNANGKLDRRSLTPVSDTPSSSHANGVAPESDQLLNTIIGIFEEVLEIQPVRPDDHIFEIGGHSLLAIKISNRIRSRVCDKAPLGIVFRNPTPRALTERVKELQLESNRSNT